MLDQLGILYFKGFGDSFDFRGQPRRNSFISLLDWVFPFKFMNRLLDGSVVVLG